MSFYLDSLLSYYYKKGLIKGGVLFDANLLLVYWVGLLDRKLIKSVSSTSTFSEEDYERIMLIRSRFKRIFITPHIISEVSNLSFNDIHGPQLVRYLKQLVNSLKGFEEKYITKERIAENSIFFNVGFTDTSIVEAAKELKLFVVTTDGPLSGFLGGMKIATLNFNSFRRLDPIK